MTVSATAGSSRRPAAAASPRCGTTGACRLSCGRRAGCARGWRRAWKSGLFLERGIVLRGGDLLLAEDGTVIEVVAALETVSTVRDNDATRLARAGYHLGNRHVPVEIGSRVAALRARSCARRHGAGAGLTVVVEQAPFEPEGGGSTAGHSHGPTRARPTVSGSSARYAVMTTTEVCVSRHARGFVAASDAARQPRAPDRRLQLLAGAGVRHRSWLGARRSVRARAGSVASAHQLSARSMCRCFSRLHSAWSANGDSALATRWSQLPDRFTRNR